MVSLQEEHPTLHKYQAVDMRYNEFDVVVNDIDEHELELVIYSALLLILIPLDFRLGKPMKLRI